MVINFRFPTSFHSNFLPKEYPHQIAPMQKQIEKNTGERRFFI